MASTFAVYRVRGQPRYGDARAYVGCTAIPRGSTAKKAVEARIAVHQNKGPTSAAWLRPCTGLTYEILAQCTKASMLYCELFHTLKVMKSHGCTLTRGGPYCRIALDWKEVCALVEATVDHDFDTFRQLLRTLDLSVDVQRHLQGACYNCGKRGHLAKDCTRTLAPHVEKAERQKRFSAYWMPVPKAVYYLEETRHGHVRRRWRYSVPTGVHAKRRKAPPKHFYINIKEVGPLWGVFAGNEVCSQHHDLESAIQEGANEATWRCQVPANRLSRPAGVSKECDEP